MAKTTKQLSDTEIRRAKPTAKEYNLADGKGLYLRIKPIGSKLWVFNYTRPITRKRANLSLGNYPNLTLSDARTKAQEFRHILATGVDPQEHRQSERQKAKEAYNNTFELVTQKWLKLKKAEISESYYKKINDRLNKYILPKMGKTPIHQIKAVTTIEIISPIANEGKLETTKKLCRWVNEIMTYAVNTGMTVNNPLAGISKAFNSPKVVNLPSLKPSELPELMTRLNMANIKLVTRCLIEWQLHTMVRPAEASGTRWEEIDLENKLWAIPAERMKTKRIHEIPLTSQALLILEILQPISGHREFVFPSNHNSKASANSQSANRALIRMGFKGRLVAHGLRALASTTLNEQEFKSDVIETALAHIDKNTIRAAYNRSQYLAKRRVMMQWWSNHIEAAAQGNLSLAGLKAAKSICSYESIESNI